MAAGGHQTGVEKMLKNVCPVCLEKYRRPKLLPCFHTFCQHCLEGVAGSSPSFPCPSCRQLVLLPPGGVQALQTNFYIDDDHSTPPQRLCDLCAGDKEATHYCLQCQQRYCLPCCKIHDSIGSCQGHNVVFLTAGAEAGCVKKASGKMEMCPKHPDQRLLLHCNPCQADLCLQCKLTQHEGHLTQDLAELRSKIKDRLKDRLETVTLEIRQIDHLIGAFAQRSTKLQERKQKAEQACQDRAVTLHQWVDQSLEDVVWSIQKSAEQLSTSWQHQTQQLHSMRCRLHAQQEHVSHVLREGEEADLVSLHVQLSASSEENLHMTDMTRELTKDIPAFSLEHSPYAINQLQLRAFLGVLEPSQQISGAEESPVPSPPSTVSSRASGYLSPTPVKGSHVKPGTVLSARKCEAVVGKKPSRELIYSKNSRSSIKAICPISHNRLWVWYNPEGDYDSPVCLKLLTAAGQEIMALERAEKYTYTGHLSVLDDHMFSWRCGERYARLISPDGSAIGHDMGGKVGYFFSRAAKDVHYSKADHTGHLHSVNFAWKENTPTVRKKFEHSYSSSFCTKSPFKGSPRHVSAGGRFFAFIVADKVDVYAVTAGSQYSTITCSYTSKNQPRDARFCLIDGQEMLLVIADEDNKVHVVDHTAEGQLVCYLDTGPLNLNRPRFLATDYDQHVWIGCEGGKVVVVDLSP